MAFVADCGVSTVLLAPFMTTTVGFLLRGGGVPTGSCVLRGLLGAGNKFQDLNRLSSRSKI